MKQSQGKPIHSICQEILSYLRSTGKQHELSKSYRVSGDGFLHVIPGQMHLEGFVEAFGSKEDSGVASDDCLT